MVYKKAMLNNILIFNYIIKMWLVSYSKYIQFEIKSSKYDVLITIHRSESQKKKLCNR